MRVVKALTGWGWRRSNIKEGPVSKARCASSTATLRISSTLKDEARASAMGHGLARWGARHALVGVCLLGAHWYACSLSFVKPV